MTVKPCNQLAFRGHRSEDIKFIEVFLFTLRHISFVLVFPGSAQGEGEVGTVVWWAVVLKYLHEKLLKSVSSFKIYWSFFLVILSVNCQLLSTLKSQSIMLGCFLTYFCSFQPIFCWFRFPQVVQKQTLSEVVKWPVIWWPVVPDISVPKIIKIGKFFFAWQS